MRRRAQKRGFAGPSGLTYLWDPAARRLSHAMLPSHQSMHVFSPIVGRNTVCILSMKFQFILAMTFFPYPYIVRIQRSRTWVHATLCGTL